MKYQRTGLTRGKGDERRKYHPVYKAWQNMLSRCTNPSANNFHRYGGRGVRVCKRWLVSANFVKDMLPSWFEDAHLDRTNNNGNYTPKNCQWVTRDESNRNTSRVISVKWKQKDYCLIDFFKLGVCQCSYETLRRRIHKGWPLSEAMKASQFA